MINVTNIILCFIKSSFINKWNKFLLLISIIILSNTAFADVNSKDLAEINQMFLNQQKEKIKTIIGKVDIAIDSVIKLPDNERKRYAVYIALACKKHNIDPRIMISILKVESDFRQKAISSTGDYSVAQINFKVWEKAFRKLDKSPLRFERLKKDEAYAVYRMAEILAYYKEQYAKNDKIWFSRYHSGTPKFKNIYTDKLKKEFKKLLVYGPNMLDGLPDNTIHITQIYLGQ